MEFKLMKVTGIDDALMSLKMSYRHWTEEEHIKAVNDVHNYTDIYGKVISGDKAYDTMGYLNFLDSLDKLAKWGAGVGNGEAYAGDGHETILRFIDFTFITEGLHRGAQDDLDAHAARFNNRIVRASTRLAMFGDEMSDWYKGKILSVEEALKITDDTLPDVISDEDGTMWVHRANGYVRIDLIKDKDVIRGTYPLSIPSTAIWKINFQDLRHVYMRRNIKTTAAPELKEGIEQLADQIEEWIPGDLGKLIRHDYAKVGENEYKLVHIHDIQKVYNPRDPK